MTWLKDGDIADTPQLLLYGPLSPELNMSRSSGTGSSRSLSNTSTGNEASCVADNPASKVVSWAVCFERLLEDPVGVRYFTAFLKSEVSAENILFWKACEKFQKIPANCLNELKKEARVIFETFLSENSFHAVNIDDTARVNKSDLETPTPDMFSKAQQQIFKLMKFDSYARFVRSPLYQRCTLATVEGRPLPELDSHDKCVTPTPDRRSAESKTPSSDSKATKTKNLEKRGSWGADVTYRRIAASRQDSQISVKSNSSLELGSSSHKLENGNLSPDPESRVDKYCCVFLPDGTASLAPARPGLPIRDMLSGLCEKRGFPMKDVIIYYHGKDKNTCPRQQPLTLDQDSSFLMDQQVSLELRITFKLEVVFAQKTMGIVAKSSKTLGDSLSSVLEKHQLRIQDVVVSVSESKEPLNLNTTIYSFANKTLCLDRVKSLSVEMKGSPTAERGQMSTKPRKRNEMDGLVEMLTRVQCSRADDQRGLLTKEQLELPQFLQLQTQQGKGEDDQQKAENAQESSLHSHTPPAKAGHTKGQACLNGGQKDSNEKNRDT